MHRSNAVRRLAAGLCLLAALGAGSGCVHRRLIVRSDPPGALVLLDGEEIGYTPTGVDFTYYGTREITLVKDGYETLTVQTKVAPPWYQRGPLEFVSDNLSPVQVTDRHELPTFQLQQQMIVSSQELLQRANALRSEARVGE